MHRTCRPAVLVLSIAALGFPAAYAGENNQGGNDQGNNSFGGKHVLLISIDGMHALDYENCVNNSTCLNLASLGKSGVTYTRTSTSRPSDSFPGA